MFLFYFYLFYYIYNNKKKALKVKTSHGEWKHSGHVVEIMLWYPMSCCGEASMVVVCGVHGRLNIYTYIYNTNLTVNTSWWNIYI